jgi:3-oxoadipate enol-lactonase
MGARRAGVAIETIYVGKRPRIAIDVAGVDDASRPLVMFLHGNGFSRLDWHDQLAAFAPRYRAAAWDARGHGASDDYDGPYRFADACDDLVRVLDHLGVEAAHLVGHSMGGRILLEFQRRYPARMRSLVLASVSAKREPPLSPQELETRLARRVIPLRRGDDLAAIAEANTRHYLAPGATPQVFARVRDRLANVRRESYAKTLETVVSYVDFPPYDSIRAPCLVLTGSEDPQATPAFARACADAIPGAKLVLIPNSGHMVNMEQPDAFNAAVLAFIDTLE